MEFKNVKFVAFDFDGVFTNNSVFVSENGEETVQCNRSDGIGLARLQEVNVKFYIISTESNKVVSQRAKKIKSPVIQNVKDKALVLKQICKKEGFKLKETMFVGNDINDLPALKIVGYPVGVNDSYSEIDGFIKFRTKKKGGMGAVREICDLIYFSKNKSNE